MEAPKLNRSLVLASLFFTAYAFVNPSILRFAMDPYEGFSASVGDLAARFVLFQFLHGSFFHLLGNSFFLLYFGSPVEREMGTSRYAAFFLASTAFVGACVLALAQGPTIGMSGFAMAVLTYSALRMKEARNPDYRGALFFVALNVGFGFVGNVSLVGHAAGAVAGGAFRIGERFF
jgi:membrane associated rhomboid family serine protease